MEDLDLVLLFADADAQRFVTKLVDRGIERGCLRKIVCRSLRDPMHDARVAREPTAALAPYLSHPTSRFMVVLDHHGSGAESAPPAKLEASVRAAFERAGVRPDRSAAIAFEPELEVALVPVWERVIDVLARKRAMPATKVAPDSADPKTSWESALRAYRLRSGSALFGELAQQLSLDGLKRGDALGRLAQQLVAWFGPEGNR